MAWKEMGFLDDAQKEELGRGAAAVPWIEFTAKTLGVEAKEE